MEKSAQTLSAQAREAVLRRVVPVARAAAAAASALAGGLGLLGLFSALAAGWLAYVLFTRFSLVSGLAVLVLAFLLTPALMLGLLYFALREVMRVPERLRAVLGQLRVGSDVLRAGLVQPRSVIPASKMAALKDFAKLFWDLRSLGAEVTEVLAVLRGAALIANPAFMVIALVSVAEALILIFVALVVALFALF